MSGMHAGLRGGGGGAAGACPFLPLAHSHRPLAARLPVLPLCSQGGSQAHYLLGLRILNMLVSEMNAPTAGRSLTQHRKIAVNFRRGRRLLAGSRRLPDGVSFLTAGCTGRLAGARRRSAQCCGFPGGAPASLCQPLLLFPASPALQGPEPVQGVPAGAGRAAPPARHRHRGEAEGAGARIMVLAGILDALVWQGHRHGPASRPLQRLPTPSSALLSWRRQSRWRCSACPLILWGRAWTSRARTWAPSRCPQVRDFLPLCCTASLEALGRHLAGCSSGSGERGDRRCPLARAARVACQARPEQPPPHTPRAPPTKCACSLAAVH